MFRTNEEHNAEKKSRPNFFVFNHRGRRERRVFLVVSCQFFYSVFSFYRIVQPVIRSVILFSSMFVFLCVSLRPLRFIFPVFPESNSSKGFYLFFNPQRSLRAQSSFFSLRNSVFSAVYIPRSSSSGILIYKFFRGVIHWISRVFSQNKPKLEQ